MVAIEFEARLTELIEGAGRSAAAITIYLHVSDSNHGHINLLSEKMLGETNGRLGEGLVYHSK